MQAMILAAGFGTRLLPYTKVLPKPLFPVLNRPLLLLIIERLKKIGVDHIIVNCHYLADQIVELLAGIDGVLIQHEKNVLGTGGGLRLALDKMNDEPLLIVNGDIYHTVDLQSLLNHHVASGLDVTLAMHDHQRFNSVSVDGNRIISFDNKNDANNLAFTGLHVINPEILKLIPLNEPSCIIQRYRYLLSGGNDINIFRADKYFWTDIGTPADYLSLHAGIIKKEIPKWSELTKVDDDIIVKVSSLDSTNLTVNNWACIGNAKIGNNVQIDSSIIWDGAVIEDNTCVSNQIVV